MLSHWWKWISISWRLGYHNPKAWRENEASGRCSLWIFSIRVLCQSLRIFPKPKSLKGYDFRQLFSLYLSWRIWIYDEKNFLKTRYTFLSCSWNRNAINDDALRAWERNSRILRVDERTQERWESSSNCEEMVRETTRPRKASYATTRSQFRWSQRTLS